jgi:hypothetical protein
MFSCMLFSPTVGEAKASRPICSIQPQRGGRHAWKDPADSEENGLNHCVAIEVDVNLPGDGKYGDMGLQVIWEPMWQLQLELK